MVQSLQSSGGGLVVGELQSRTDNTRRRTTLCPNNPALLTLTHTNRGPSESLEVFDSRMLRGAICESREQRKQQDDAPLAAC